MIATDPFSQYCAPLLSDTYDVVDRIVLNGDFGLGSSPGGFRCWWRQLHGTLDNLDDTHLMRLAGRFSRRVRGWAKKHHIPVIYCPAGERKHPIAERHRPAGTTELDLCYEAVQCAMRQLFKTLGIAA